ncbi:MAG: precorrin-2 dehydrogenase/sirohydrochlorin ferrochelatase family protein, partial [Myxococcaceae bacterium]
VRAAPGTLIMDLDFPIALRLKDRPVLVVGAGKIAEGRVHQLLEVGARVSVISPEATEALRGNPAVRLSLRPYQLGDCAGAFIVFTASNDRAVNEAVVHEARERGILVNAADAPELCDFYVPSIGRNGAVTVAVSTAGQAPALARVLRGKIMKAITADAGRVASLIGRLRKLLPSGAERTELFNALAQSVNLETELLMQTHSKQGGAIRRSLLRRWRARRDETFDKTGARP